MSLVESSNTEISGASEVPLIYLIGILSTSDNFVVRTNNFLKSSLNSYAQTSFILVRREFANALLCIIGELSFFANTTKNTVSGHTSSFLIFSKDKNDPYFLMRTSKLVLS